MLVIRRVDNTSVQVYNKFSFNFPKWGNYYISTTNTLCGSIQKIVYLVNNRLVVNNALGFYRFDRNTFPVSERFIEKFMKKILLLIHYANYTFAIRAKNIL